MPAARGSKQAIKAIAEVTYGTTPATPVMVEIPVNGFNSDVAVGMIRSGQIRSHPFVDRLMKGVSTYDLEAQTELQDDTHDLLLERLLGTTFATNAAKVTDALLGMTLESGHPDVTLFDSFSGVCIRRGEFTFNAQPDAVVTVNYGMMAKAGVLDAATTIASSTTAAVVVDPFVFSEATVTIAGASRPVTACTFTLERTVDPLYVLGTTTPREYIPSDVTLTGSITVPLEDNIESTRLTGFTEAALVIAATKGTAHRTFTMPKINYARMGRRVQNRGVILQEIDFEAKYDSTSQTIMTVTRSA